jgi:hypothetical protein
MRVEVRVSRAAVCGYVAGLAFNGACWLLTGEETWLRTGTAFGMFAPLGYFAGRSDASEESS